MPQSDLSRRALLTCLTAAMLAATGPARSRSLVAPSPVRLRSLEQSTKGGRLGVCLLDATTGEVTGHRMDERFAMCSTFKMPLAAAILEAADKGKLRLDEMVTYSKADIVPHAPVTAPNLTKGGMSIAALAEAAQKTSDNVAANLLIRKLGGPAQVTGIWRGWGDTMTRLDRYEPQMNMSGPDDFFDTTTPRAMAQMVARICVSALLKPASRDMLIRWMIETQTGAKRIRAGLPAEWKAGDKTGTLIGTKDLANKYNDIAIFWPVPNQPMIATAYFEAPDRGDKIRDEDQRILADVGRIATQWTLTRS